MANQQNQDPPTYSPSKTKPHTFVPNPEETRKQPPRPQSGTQPGTRAGQVEIGEPVPEKDRKTRASRSKDKAREGDQRFGRGETGEDEDLPDDDRGVEGSANERH